MLGARGKVDQVKSMISELTVRAPVAASVEAWICDQGTSWHRTRPPRCCSRRTSSIVRIYVPETELGRMHIGQAVPVVVDSFPDKSFQGVVEHINGVGEYSPRNLQTADERADQVFAARVGFEAGWISFARAWPPSSECPNDGDDIAIVGRRGLQAIR